MANPYYALRRIRRTRSALPTPPSTPFDTYRPDYEAVLVAVYDLGGDDMVDDLVGWIVVQTATDGTLPTPIAVRHRAAALLDLEGIEIPPDSTLDTT